MHSHCYTSLFSIVADPLCFQESAGGYQVRMHNINRPLTISSLNPSRAYISSPVMVGVSIA